MASLGLSPSVVRFGDFELDVRTGDLKRDGRTQRLQGQPAQLLALLVRQAGELVTREELRKALWPEDTFVDFDHGLNNAVNRIREALADAASSPRYIETVPRRGYRFIAKLKGVSAAPALELVNTERRPAPAQLAGLRSSGLRLWTVAAIFGLMLATAALVMIRMRQSRVLPRPAIESIAVLPLQDLSADTRQEYVAEGITDALITDLAKIRSLRVMSRTAIMAYQGKHEPLEKIAKALKVDAIVEGTVLHSGDRVLVTAQLIDTRSGAHLWSETYDRDMGDVIALENELAFRIASQVRITLTPEERGQLATGGRPVDPQAYKLFLLGRQDEYRQEPEAWQRAIEYFQRAIELDPNDAAAYAGLSYCWLELGLRARVPPNVAMPKGEAAARRAIELNPNLAQAHFNLAFGLMYYDWNWNAAEAEFGRGFKLSPGDADGHRWYATYLMFRGRMEEAVMEQKNTLALDPLSLSNQISLGQKLYYARRYEQAIRELQDALQKNPNSYRAHYALADVYKHQRKFSSAVEEYAKAFRIEGNEQAGAAAESAFREKGFRGYLRWNLDRELRQLDTPRGSPLMVALAYAELGDIQRAFPYLEESLRQRRGYLLYLKADPDFDNLRSDARFQDLVRRIGL